MAETTADVKNADRGRWACCGKTDAKAIGCAFGWHRCDDDVDDDGRRGDEDEDDDKMT